MAIADDTSTVTTSFWHPFADMGAVSQAELVIDRGEGVYVYDADGRRYLDGTASLWYANLGYGRSRHHARRRGADGPARRLPDVRRLLQPARQRARRPARRARPDGRRQGLPRLRRRRRDRHRREDRAAPLDPPGPAGARPHHQPHQRLPRHARVRHVDRRHRGQHGQLGPAGPAHVRGRVRLAARARAGDPPRRPRARRRVLLRAGDRRRRRVTRRPRATSRASPTCAPSTASCS